MIIFFAVAVFGLCMQMCFKHKPLTGYQNINVLSTVNKSLLLNNFKNINFFKDYSYLNIFNIQKYYNFHVFNIGNITYTVYLSDVLINNDNWFAKNIFTFSQKHFNKYITYVLLFTIEIFLILCGVDRIQYFYKCSI